MINRKCSQEFSGDKRQKDLLDAFYLKVLYIIQTRKICSLNVA